MIIRRYVDDVHISDFQTFSQFVHFKLSIAMQLLHIYFSKKYFIRLKQGLHKEL